MLPRFLITVKRSPLAELFASKLLSRKWNFALSHSESKGEYSYYPDAWCKAPHTWGELKSLKIASVLFLAESKDAWYADPNYFFPCIHLAAVTFPSSHRRKSSFILKFPIHTQIHVARSTASLSLLRVYILQAYLNACIRASMHSYRACKLPHTSS